MEYVIVKDTGTGYKKIRVFGDMGEALRFMREVEDPTIRMVVSYGDAEKFASDISKHEEVECLLRDVLYALEDDVMFDEDTRELYADIVEFIEDMNGDIDESILSSAEMDEIVLGLTRGLEMEKQDTIRMLIEESDGEPSDGLQAFITGYEAGIACAKEFFNAYAE